MLYKDLQGKVKGNGSFVEMNYSSQQQAGQKTFSGTVVRQVLDYHKLSYSRIKFDATVRGKRMFKFDVTSVANWQGTWVPINQWDIDYGVGVPVTPPTPTPPPAPIPTPTPVPTPPAVPEPMFESLSDDTIPAGTGPFDNLNVAIHDVNLLDTDSRAYGDKVHEEIMNLLDNVNPALVPPAGLFPSVPARDPGFKIPTDIATALRTMLNLAKTDSRINVRFTGPQGTGKTSLAKEAAVKLNWNFVKIDVGGIREPADWFSHTVAENGSTRAIPSLFVYAITTPGTVILLDEFNRVPTQVHNAIYGLLDEHGWAWSDDLGCKINRADNVIVIATMNQEDTNLGVYDLDSAVADRFPFEIRLELPPAPVLTAIITSRTGLNVANATIIADISAAVQDLVTGTTKTLTHGTGLRSLIAAAKLVNSGLALDVACMTTIAAAFSRSGGVDSEQAIVAALIAGKTTGTP